MSSYNNNRRTNGRAIYHCKEDEQRDNEVAPESPLISWSAYQRLTCCLNTRVSRTMNMGGGILLRTVGRAAGSTTPTASTAFCSACTGQVPRPSSLRTVCRACQNATLSHQASGTVNPNEFDDWEFADDLVSDNVNRSLFAQDTRLLFSSTPSASSHSSVCDDTLPSDNRDWHVFGLPPTFDEVYAATTDLQAAFIESNNDHHTKSTSSCSTAVEREAFFPQASNKGSDSEKEPHSPHSGEWVEPQLFLPNKAIVQVTKSPVHEAFHLLQNDSNVKGAVMSIASDPDVWHAMMRNEKVQELRRIFEKSQGTGKLDTSPMPELPSKADKDDDKDDPFGSVFSAFRVIGNMSMQLVCQVQDDLSKFVRNVFSLLSGANYPSAKEDPADKAMKSTMMLAVLVVAVVLLKRLPV
ncbi:hypothetical protein GOP47_0011216 [Adiantum capillus-veneris]|uniref:Transmembrane protein n=1 Tax=Adiantum capillus-veneris TaxID=13818 RepID=A0A9D4UTT1_ADICA|nr:hypothetical protein GOP47_0011216 [Adiantum capillus-veneris]